MLEAAKQYISIICKHLSREQLPRWVGIHSLDSWSMKQRLPSKCKFLTTLGWALSLMFKRSVITVVEIMNPGSARSRRMSQPKFSRLGTRRCAKLVIKKDTQLSFQMANLSSPSVLSPALSSSPLTMLARRSCSIKSRTRSACSANTVRPPHTRQKPATAEPSASTARANTSLSYMNSKLFLTVQFLL